MLLVLVGAAAVLFVWFQTPTVELQGSSEGESTTVTCANAGPSRWSSPTVSRGQEVSADANMVAFSLQVMKNDIESLRVDRACSQARDAHTNTLIVTTFAAGTAILIGYAALNRRRR